MIEFENVAIVRGGRTVLADVTCSVAAGHALAVLGRCGAGKTSLVEALATLVPLAGGDIRVAGNSVRSAASDVRMQIGYVPAAPTMWPRVRADEWLELFAREAGLHGKPLRDAVAKALEFAGVAHDAAVAALPAGQGKRLLFGRALLHTPDILVADDPFGGLDTAEQDAVEHLLADVHLGGRTVVAAIDRAAPVGCFTHLAVLGEGGLRRFGPAVREAFDDGRQPWRYRIGCPGAAEAAAPLLRRAGVDARAVDADTLECRHATAQGPVSDLVAAVVRGGIAVESAGFHPPWMDQLVDGG